MKTISVAASVMMLVFAAPTMAVAPMSAETLNRYCEGYSDAPDSTLSQKCVAYVGGFLDGAVATDARVAENVVNELAESESFTERAIRTRVYGKLRDIGPSVYAEFCVGQPVPLEDVVLKIAAELDERESIEGIAARNIVYAVLRKNYPCKP